MRRLVLFALVACSAQLNGQAQTSQTIASQLVAAHPPGEAYSTMVEGSRGKSSALTLSDDAFKLLTGVNTREVGRGWMQPWHDELTRLRASSVGMPEVIAVMGTRGLVSENNISKESLERYLTRLKAISPAMLESWRGAIKPPAGDVILIHFLVAHDPLFAGADSLDGRMLRELKRFESIPNEAVGTWAAATGYPSVDSAFELLRVESLFVGDVFSKEMFDSALPIAKKLLSQRAIK